MQIILGITFGVLISILAWRLGSLTISGAFSAAIVGSLIFGLGGLSWGVQLLGFFISSSILSKSFQNKKIELSEKFSKGNQRDSAQVFANGAIGTLLAIANAYNPSAKWIWFAFVGAIAAVNADTWATELGVLNPSHPRLITNGRKVEPGTSGGISLSGFLASLSGGGVIGCLGALFTPLGDKWHLFLTAILAGFCGSLVDSLLGATIQAIYECPTCEKETERHPSHTCGSETSIIRGWSWLNNDVVNFLASIVGAVVATGTWLFLA